MNVVSLGQRRLLFHPVFKNLSVFDIAWEIDGEEVSRDMPLDYTFEAETESVVVTFRLNREDELTLSKRVWPDGRVEEVGDESISTNESTSISDLQSNAITERVEDLNTLLTKLLSELELLESNETPITNEEVTNEEVTNEEVTNEEVTNEEVTNEEVTNEEVTNEETLPLPSSSTSSTDLKISSTSSNSNNSLVRHNFVPSSHDRIIRGFQTKTRLSSLIEHLKDLQNGRFLQFGNREHVQNDSVSYMIIVDLSYDRVVTILSPEKNSKRYDLQKGETIEIEAIRDTFKGYAPVYVQFLRY